jgi:CDP-diacylglycerol---glycerol-3-phosphate 3-phosphatidyltransferase
VTAPNAVSLARVALVPVVAALILVDVPGGRWWAAGTFLVASLTDSLDGYLARSRDAVTVFGTFLDPLADKLLVSSTLIALVSLDRVPAWVAMVIVAREFAVTGLRLVAVKREVIGASWLGKWKTFAQMVAIALVIVHTERYVEDVALGVAVVLTLWSAVDYFARARDHFAAAQTERTEPVDAP